MKVLRWLLVLGGLAVIVGVIAFVVVANEVGNELGAAGGLDSADSGDTSVAWTPDGQNLVVARGEDETSRIYELARDGSDVHRLIQSPDDSESPAVSRSGRIAFVGVENVGANDLYTAAADGSDVTTLTHTEDSEGDPSWSPDGREIAFVRGYDLDQASELYVIRADGSGLRRITRGRGANARDPVWSPDGRSIAYVDFPGVYVVSAHSSGRRKLVGNGIAAPEWSPDGRRLAYVVNSSTIAVVTLASGKVRKLRPRVNLSGPDDVQYGADDLAWSPDGRTLAYAENGGVYVLRLATGAVEQLT